MEMEKLRENVLWFFYQPLAKEFERQTLTNRNKIYARSRVVKWQTLDKGDKIQL